MKKHADIITVGLSRLNVAEDSFLSAYFKQIAFFIIQFFKRERNRDRTCDPAKRNATLEPSLIDATSPIFFNKQHILYSERCPTRDRETTLFK